MTNILVTGCAGFIGFHISKRLLDEGCRVTGLDNLNDYYDVKLKKARLAQLERRPGFSFAQIDLADRGSMEEIFKSGNFEKVLNLAAQVGPRYSLINPHAYVQTNLVGFLNVLEGCRHTGVRHLVYASSSSVYGSNRKQPFSTTDRADYPVSLYAATKRANELMAYSYAQLFQIPSTGLRFFTVYGPWGRPDMAPILFTKALYEGRPINVFNYGHMSRDFTYVDDVVEGLRRILDKIPQVTADEENSDKAIPNTVPQKLYNIGNNTPIPLLDFIRALEMATSRKANLNLLPAQPGDVPSTWADTDDLHREVGFRPRTPLAEGVRRFVAWFRDYYRVGGEEAEVIGSG